jgi:hypothetical protein
MTRHRPRTLAAATLAATGLLLAACGSGNSPSHAAVSPKGTMSDSNSAPSMPASTVSTVSATGATTAAPLPAGAAVACTLVTEKDAAAALGKDPGPGSAFSSHGSTQCQYGSYQTAFLLVNLTPSHGRAGYDLIRSNRKLGTQVSVVTIAGVGDRAFEISEHNTAGIYFNKGDAVVVVSVSMQTATSPPQGPALALAKIAASRL